MATSFVDEWPTLTLKYDIIEHPCIRPQYTKKTLPKTSLKMQWISVRFYEISDIKNSF